jgi:hypothetical protein
MPAAATNRGRWINFINGITGVAAGASAIVNLPTNARYHRLTFQCKAVNYTGGTSETVVRITGSGTGATITPTIVNGAVTGGTVTAGGSGWNVGDTFTLTDTTGIGFVGTVATVTGGPPGAIATFTVTSGGSPSAISPATFFTGIKLSVGGVNMRDISPAQTVALSQYCGYVPKLGELPVFFTAPWRNVNFHNEVTSWDVFGQSSFSVTFNISPNVVNPTLVGVMEFDYFRNLKPVTSTAGGKTTTTKVPFLQPVSQHAYSIPVPAGIFTINTIPWNYPISRMYLVGSSPGNIAELDVFQDQNEVLQTTAEQNQQMYLEYGFLASPATNGNTSVPNGTVTSPFDVAYISDPDQRYWKALKCANSLNVRVTSAVAQTVTVIVEAMPGAYQS